MKIQLKIFIICMGLVFSTYQYSSLRSSNSGKGIGNTYKGIGNNWEGNYNNFNGNYNQAVGNSNDIQGNSNNIYGNSNVIHGNSNFVQGTQNSINGQGNLVLGSSNVVLSKNDPQAKAMTENIQKSLNQRFSNMFGNFQNRFNQNTLSQPSFTENQGIKNLQKMMGGNSQFKNYKQDYNPFSRFNNPTNFMPRPSYNNFDGSKFPKKYSNKKNNNFYAQSNYINAKPSNFYYPTISSVYSPPSQSMYGFIGQPDYPGQSKAGYPGQSQAYYSRQSQADYSGQSQPVYSGSYQSVFSNPPSSTFLNNPFYQNAGFNVLKNMMRKK